jgi:hypothetical protein
MLVDAVTPVILIADTEVADKNVRAVKAFTAMVLEIMGGISTGFLFASLVCFL